MCDLDALAREINGDESLKADGVWSRVELKGTEYEFLIVYSNERYPRMSVTPAGAFRMPDSGTLCWPALDIIRKHIGQEQA